MRDSIVGGFKELMTKPHHFLRRPEFFMIWGVYASTVCCVPVPCETIRPYALLTLPFLQYLTANFVNTGFEWKEKDSAVPRFFFTTAVNMTTCIAKDRVRSELMHL